MRPSTLRSRCNQDVLGSVWRMAAILAVLIIISLSHQMFAQDYLQAVGTPVFTSAEPVELGSVNAANGNLHLEIPIASFPQRGLKPLTYKFVYDSRIWVQSGGSGWYPNTTASPWLGWRFVTSADMGTMGNNSYLNFCGNNPPQADEIMNYFYWQAPDGTIHNFPGQLQFTNHCGGSVQLCTGGSDGTGYFLSVNTSQSCVGTGGHAKNMGWTVIAPDGSQVYANAMGANFEDTNGNYYSRDTNNNVIDTLGRTPVVVTSSCGTNQTCYDVLTSQGGTSRSRWIVTTESISVNTAFPVWGNWSGTLTSIQSIKLPDGTTYTFSYNSGTTSGHYGELTGITLPTGGQISYGYSLYQDGLSHYNRWVTQHTSGGGTTNYTLGNVNTTTATQTVTVTKPSGDCKVYTFQVAYETYYYGEWVQNGAWRSSVKLYSASGTLLETITDSLNSAGTLLSSETVTFQTPAGSISKQKTFSYADPYAAHFTTINEWNYYSGSPAPNPDRITHVTYLHQTNSAYAPNPGMNILTLPAKVQVTDGLTNPLSETDYSYDTTAVGSLPGIAQHDDANYGATMTVRGNRTQIQKATGYTNGNPTLLTVETMNYDETGQMSSSTDANNNTTSYSYADCYLTGSPPSTYTPTTATNAYLTKTVLPASGNTTACYYWNTGNTAWTKDQNGSQTSYLYTTYNTNTNDPLDRLITTTFPAPPGGWTLNVYSTPPTTVDKYTGIGTANPTTTCTSAGSCRHDQTKLDGYGRTTDKILVNDPDGLTTAHTDYDANGRVGDVCHPYRSTNDSTYGCDTTSDDGMDRPTQITHPDTTASKTYYGAAVTAAGGLSSQQCFAGSCHTPAYPTLLVDESGKMRQTWTDAFGNIVEVDEPLKSAAIGTFGTPTVTYYLYDLLSDLQQVTVKNPDYQECSRYYTYDPLSRMTSSNEPETGNGSCSSHIPTNYYYTTSGGALCSGDPSLLCRSQDGRSITKTYQYNDALNRLTGLSYSDGTTPAVQYFYDGNTTGWSACATTPPSLTDPEPKGRMTSMCDGSGAVSWAHDAHGNVATEERTIGTTVTKNIGYTYNEDDTLAKLTYPSSRTVSFAVGNAERATSATDGNGTQYASGPSSGWEYTPNGAVSSVVYGKSGTFGGLTETRNYYNRLWLKSLSATSSAGTALSLTPFNYNNNGELNSITNSVDNGRSQSFSYDSLSRISSASSTATSGSDCWGQTYNIDNVANLWQMTVSQCSSGGLNAPVNQNNQFKSPYQYDQAGNLTSGDLYPYTYNGENEITTANGVTYTYDGNRMRVEKSSGTLYWRDTSGNTIAETNLSGADLSEYVFFAGRRIARIDPNANVCYYQADQIGSTRAIVNSSGALCYDADFTPFGWENLPTGINSCPQNYKFAGYERDSETGLDYALNRYYNLRLGRFMNPDPSGIKAAKLNNPQSLNRYPYVLNNPLTHVDPTGLDMAVSTYLIEASGCVFWVTSEITFHTIYIPFVGSFYVLDDSWSTYEKVTCYSQQQGQQIADAVSFAENPIASMANPSKGMSDLVWGSNLNQINTPSPCVNVSGQNICPVKIKNSPTAAGRRSLFDPFCSLGLTIPQVAAPNLTTNPFTFSPPNIPLPKGGFFGCEEETSSDPFFSPPSNSGNEEGGP